MKERRDSLVDALKRAGVKNPTDDDIDTAGGQLDHLCDPVTGAPNGALSAACDRAAAHVNKTKLDPGTDPPKVKVKAKAKTQVKAKTKAKTKVGRKSGKKI